jgi:hypothetical protein
MGESCPSRPGIVAGVTAFLLDSRPDHFGCPAVSDTKRFFGRVLYEPVTAEVQLTRLKDGFAELARRFELNWQMRDLLHMTSPAIVERRVLARAVRFHLKDRSLVGRQLRSRTEATHRACRQACVLFTPAILRSPCLGAGESAEIIAHPVSCLLVVIRSQSDANRTQRRRRASVVNEPTQTWERRQSLPMIGEYSGCRGAQRPTL